MDNSKNFDAVQMMRDIREKLSERYWKHPDILKKEMEAIRQKYNLKLEEPKSNWWLTFRDEILLATNSWGSAIRNHHDSHRDCG